MRAEWQAAVALRFGGLIEAQLRAAMGASVVVAKMDGTWAHIPNPDATILARVQAGDEAYRLTTVAPNPAMLEQIFDRLLGRAREVLEVEVPAMPSTSDAELAASNYDSIPATSEGPAAPVQLDRAEEPRGPELGGERGVVPVPGNELRRADAQAVVRWPHLGHLQRIVSIR